MAHQKFIFYKKIEDGQYEIYFGDGIIGKSLEDGNIINVSYVVTNKTEALTVQLHFHYQVLFQVLMM